MSALADQFCKSATKYDCNPQMTVHDRWTNTLILCPFVRDKCIYDDFHAALQDTYENGTYDDLFGASELVLLRWRFYTWLLHNDIGLRHINLYETTAAYTWMCRFSDKIDQVQQNKRRTRKEKPIALKHDWLN